MPKGNMLQTPNRPAKADLDTTALANAQVRSMADSMGPTSPGAITPAESQMLESAMTRAVRHLNK